MAEKTLNKIKNKALNLASTALLRVELANAEPKLKKRFMALGQKLHGAVRDDLLQTIKDDPSVVELLGAIEEEKRHIESLRKRIENPGAESEET
ncbi:hypothetical protein [Fibrobacter sp.]|uniref:hypothetical protein n=1 Tax=Fibrobacter sp. TaxID=35828 RepID=UPI00263708E3|nr:hypothetical protein [Fibrobacter sp.]MDD7497478.1 hypothetical protein [Fibrobacter sp.]MDY5725388.1 hypothetical protein [Fibrobacter sp.]